MGLEAGRGADEPICGGDNELRLLKIILDSVVSTRRASSEGEGVTHGADPVPGPRRLVVTLDNTSAADLSRVNWLGCREWKSWSGNAEFSVETRRKCTFLLTS